MVRWPWAKKDDIDEQSRAISGAIIAQKIARPPTDREIAEQLQENYTLTSAEDQQKWVRAIIERDGTHDDTHDGKNDIYLMAAEGYISAIKGLTNLTDIDIDIKLNRLRMTFRDIEECCSEQDIQDGILPFLTLIRDTAEDKILASRKGWGALILKLRTESHEVIMTQGKKKRNFGMGANE